MPRISTYRADERLDDWIPDPAVRTHHRRSAATTPEALWHAARSVRLADTRAARAPRALAHPGRRPRSQTYDEMFRTEPFTVLEAGETWSVSGLCGRIWTLARDYPRLGGPEDFRDWDERGTVRVLFAHWAEPADDGARDAGERGARGSGGRGGAGSAEGAVDGDRAVRAAGGGRAADDGGAAG